MSFLVCGRTGTNNQRLRRSKSLYNELSKVKEKFRFTDNDLLEFRQRFNSLANTRGVIDKAMFLESMGVLGLDSGSFLSERIFHVVDKDKDGYITLNEYLSYFDVLINGSEEEKYELTFRLIDPDGKGYFTYEEFTEMITSMLYTWNNITGNNYVIQQNSKLFIFLDSVFAKFDLEKNNMVTLSSFKIAVAKEPELLEIFDYFNEGIIDAIQPPSELENQNNLFIAELEQLQSKIGYLKTLVKNKGLPDDVQSNYSHIQKEKTPKYSPINSGIYQGGKPEEIQRSSPGFLTSPSPHDGGRRPTVLQTFDSKIRRSALFEHLKEGSNVYDEGTSNSKNFSEVFKREGSKKGLYSRTEVETMRKSEATADNPHNRLGVLALKLPKGDADVVNTLDGMLDNSPRMEAGRKLSTFASRQSSPDESNEYRSRPFGFRNTMIEKRSSLEKGQVAQIPHHRKTSSHTNWKDLESNGSHGEIKKKDDLSPQQGFLPYMFEGQNAHTNAVNLQIIKEEKTFDELYKTNDGRTGTPRIMMTPDNKRRMSSDFRNILSSTKKNNSSKVYDKMVDEENPDAVILNFGKITFGAQEENNNNNHNNHNNKEGTIAVEGLKHRRPNSIMIQPKQVEREEILFTTSKYKGRADSLASSRKNGGGMVRIERADDKLAGSLFVPSMSSNQQHGGGNNSGEMAEKRGASPHLKLNDDIYDFRKAVESREEERFQLIAQQVDLIAEETMRMMEVLSSRKKEKKDEKGAEEKKIEILTEITSQNIHKAKKGNFVSFGHANWNLVLNMMLGIQKAVNSTIEKAGETLTVKDFSLRYIFELISKRTGEVKDNYKICTFFDYAPSVFLEIRRLYGIKNEDYLKSIGPETMLNGLIKGNLSTLAELTSSGKSGSFFYFSADGKYTLKTISRAEFHFLRKILRNYYNHLMKNPNTLIIKFYGLHKMKFTKSAQRTTKLYFIIMANVFHTSREIHVRYDLKGSTQGRITKDDDPSIAKKDLNILESKEKIVLSKDVAEVFNTLLEKDTAFFDTNRIIDYSLLFGIHNLDQDEMSTKDISQNKKILQDYKISSHDGIFSGDGTKVYFLGVIDILTEFNALKRSEYIIKRVAYGKGISAIPPSDYAKRFLKFIKGLIEVH